MAGLKPLQLFKSSKLKINPSDVILSKAVFSFAITNAVILSRIVPRGLMAIQRGLENGGLAARQKYLTKHNKNSPRCYTLMRKLKNFR